MRVFEGKRGHIIAIAVLILLPLLFFWEMVIEGQEPLAPDIQAWRPLGEWRTQAQEELGEMPLWCPVIFSGMPSYGSFISTPSAPLDLMRPLRTLIGRNAGLLHFVGLLVGSLSIYLLLIFRRKAPLCALTGSIVYTMTPYMLGLIAAGHNTKIRALYLAPLVFLAIETILKKRTVAAAGFLAAAVAYQFWSNHPQISYYTLFLGGLYVLGVLLFDRPVRWQGSGLAVGLLLGLVALVLAAGLVMEPYAAVLEYTPYSIRGAASALQESTEAGGVGWDYATAWSYSPKELVCFFFPAWFGLEGETYWGAMPFTQSTHYLGVTVILLCLFGVALSSGRRRWILLGLSAICLLIGFGRYLPLLYRPMYELLPMFNRFRVPSMIYALLPLLAAILSAEGLQRILDEEFWKRRPGGGKNRRASAAGAGAAGRIRRGWGRAVLALLILLVLWMLAGSWVTDEMRRGGAFVHAREVSQVGPQVVSAIKERPLESLRSAGGVPGILVQLVAQRMALLRSSVALGLLFLTLVGLVIEGRRRGLLKGEAAAALLFLLVAADLWVIDRKFYHPEPRGRAEAVLNKDEVTRFLEQQPGAFRIAPLSAAEFSSNRYAAFGIESVGGYQPAKLQVYDDLIRSGSIMSLPVLSMLNTRFILTDRKLDEAQFPLAATCRMPSDEPAYIHIHENPHVLPRAWFVTEVRVSPDPKALLAELRSSGFQPLRTAWVYSEAAGQLPDSLSPGEVVDIERDAHHFRARVRVEGQKPGLLVLSEIIYPPGWIATVDGGEVPILRVNHLLRAVQVAPGEHQVELRAVSRSQQRGVIANRISGLLVLAVIVGAWTGRRLRKGRRSDASDSEVARM